MVAGQPPSHGGHSHGTPVTRLHAPGARRTPMTQLHAPSAHRYPCGWGLAALSAGCWGLQGPLLAGGLSCRPQDTSSSVPRSPPQRRGAALRGFPGTNPPISSFLSHRRPCPVPPSAGARPVPGSGFLLAHGGCGQRFAAVLRYRGVCRGPESHCDRYCDTSPGARKRPFLAFRQVPGRRGGVWGSPWVGRDPPLRKPPWAAGTPAAAPQPPPAAEPRYRASSPALISSPRLTSLRAWEWGTPGCRHGLPALPAGLLALEEESGWESGRINGWRSPDGLPRLFSSVPSKGRAGKSCGVGDCRRSCSVQLCHWRTGWPWSRHLTPRRLVRANDGFAGCGGAGGCVRSSLRWVTAARSPCCPWSEPVALPIVHLTSPALITAVPVPYCPWPFVGWETPGPRLGGMQRVKDGPTPMAWGGSGAPACACPAPSFGSRGGG